MLQKVEAHIVQLEKRIDQQRATLLAMEKQDMQPLDLRSQEYERFADVARDSLTILEKTLVAARKQLDAARQHLATDWAKQDC